MCVYVPFFIKKSTESTLSPMAESSQCFIILHMQKQRTAEWEREGLLLRLWYKILWRAGVCYVSNLTMYVNVYTNT